MLNDDIKWLCGVIDAEGSFSLSYARGKRGGHYCRIRTCRLRISTTDNIIIPKICDILRRHITESVSRNKNHSNRLSVNVIGGMLRQLLPDLIPHLYTKQPQAILTLAALDIKCGSNTPYSDSESQEWHLHYSRVNELNRRGKKAVDDNEPRSHIFSWPWLAGMVDGDGTIINACFGKNKCTIKPVLKIALAHLLTIEYLKTQLNVGSLRGGGGKGNRRPIRTIRLMAEKQREILPKIIPYLRLKREQAEVALEIAIIRHSVPNGTRLHQGTARIKQLLNKLDELNASSGKSRRKRKMRL